MSLGEQQRPNDTLISLKICGNLLINIPLRLARTDSIFMFVADLVLISRLQQSEVDLSIVYWSALETLSGLSVSY